ncbi:MAG TPA: dienelactone hydrolase family protein [Woeseiaceae bacterium]|nr:dienelactone hydrolase family protein [Woeseiaceae bacterium]
MRNHCRASAALLGPALAGIGVLLLALAGCQPEPDTGKDAEASREAADRMAREHSDDVGEPSAGAAVEPERAVVAETLPYAEVNDQLYYGHFVFPSDMVEPLPALIVVHEWWGLNDGVRSMADRLAGEGYIVLAVDLFGGRVAENPTEARALIREVLENPKDAEENIRQAYQFVRDTARAPRIASLGWCFGGTWALNAALLFPNDLDAAVIYYGRVATDAAEFSGLRVPILAHFAEKDRSIPLKTVEGFRHALEAAGVAHEIHVYPDVGHAFANPSGNNYDAGAAEEAWQVSLAFLAQHLARSATAD